MCHTLNMTDYFHSLSQAYRVPLSKNPSEFAGRSAEESSLTESILCSISGYVYNVTRSTTLWSVCFFTFDRLIIIFLYLIVYYIS